MDEDNRNKTDKTDGKAMDEAKGCNIDKDDGDKTNKIDGDTIDKAD